MGDTEQLVQGHSASKGRSWHLNPSRLAPAALLMAPAKNSLTEVSNIDMEHAYEIVVYTGWIY